MCKSADYSTQLEYQNGKKFFENTPTRQGFSDSLGFPQHENTREHGLSFAKLFCRPNHCQNFNAIFRFFKEIYRIIDIVEIPFISTLS